MIAAGMTSSKTAPHGDDSGAAVAVPSEAAAPGPPPTLDTRRYVIAIAAGLIVAAGALTSGVVLVMRGASPSAATIVGSGAQPAPQQASNAPPLASIAPQSPPAVMGDHVAGGTGAAFYLRAADQQGNGQTVVVADVTFSQGSGWVVVHADVGNAPGPILGVSSLQAQGDHPNVLVTLRAPVTVSSYVFVMLHTEDDNDNTFDYPQSDQPAQLDGQIVMVPIYLKVL